MQPIYRIAALLFLLLNVNRVQAEIIIVTSVGDDGPGTLRQAIYKANTNTPGTTDYIHFNLPGTTMADRSIILSGELPALTSDIEIDGTTQPGTVFGISDAKVRIVRQWAYTNGYSNMFPVKNAKNVSFYGLYLDFISLGLNGGYAINLTKCKNIIIGVQGKGNVITAGGALVSSDVETLGNSDAIRISYNFLGIQPDGESDAGYSTTAARIILWGASEVEIDHNILNAQVRIEENYTYLATGKLTYKIHDNLGGSNYTGTRNVGFADITVSCYPRTDATGNLKDNLIEIMNNHILRGRFLLGAGYGTVIVQGNKVNTDATGTARAYSIPSGSAIEIYSGSKGLVGGDLPGEKNYIAGASIGVEAGYDLNVTIKKNSIFCNGKGIGSKETVFVESYTSTSISGSSEPNAVIEVFEGDKCDPQAHCQGKVFMGTTIADNNGKWTYTGSLPPNVVVTGTNKEGSTSEFTRATIFTQGLTIIPELCGKPGSIKGIRVTGAALIQWEDESGNVISNDIDLLSVPAGKYTLYASTSNDAHATCAVSLFTLTVPSVIPSVTTERVVLLKPCDDSNGSISNMNVQSGYTIGYKWLNERDEVVGTDYTLEKVPAGTYRMIVYSSTDCFAVSDPVVLPNQPRPKIDAAAITVTPATCTNSNGSITGVQLTGVAPYTLRWLNEQSNLKGNQQDLLNAAPGEYRLEARDNSGCAAVTSDPIKVTGTGSIKLDAGNVKITPAGCNNQRGTIKGLILTGADTYTWRNLAGDIVGNSVDLTDAVAGSYQLTATNTLACSAQSTWYVIGTTQPIQWSVKIDILFPTCNASDGQIKLSTITGGSVKAVKWTNSVTDALLGTDRNLPNAGPGKYALYVTDQNDCEQYVYTAEIPQRTLPVLTGTPLIKDETCGQGNGSIQAPAVNGEMPFLYRWVNAAGQPIGTQAALNNLKQGQYKLEVTDKFGCITTSNPYPLNNIATGIAAPQNINITIGKGQSAEIRSSYPSPVMFALYADAALTTKLQENSSGIFTLPPLFADATFYLVAKMDVCFSAPATVHVTVVDKTTVIVPTAFSPNGDGQNDIFRPRYTGISTINYFKVYSRWGTEVFSTKSLGAGWDGSNMPAGGYYYIISGTDMLGKPFLKHGSVVLIR